MDSDYLECNVDVTFILFKTLEFVKNLETFRTAAARVDEINPNIAVLRRLPSYYAEPTDILYNGCIFVSCVEFPKM